MPKINNRVVQHSSNSPCGSSSQTRLGERTRFQINPVLRGKAEPKARVFSLDTVTYNDRTFLSIYRVRHYRLHTDTRMASILANNDVSGDGNWRDKVAKGHNCIPLSSGMNLAKGATIARNSKGREVMSLLERFSLWKITEMKKKKSFILLTGHLNESLQIQQVFFLPPLSLT